MNKYSNRYEAGLYLAEQLLDYAHAEDCIVLGLPRGGVPVAYEIAKVLSLPLDVFIVRKLGAPGHEELAIGAIASGETLIFNQDIINMLGIKSSAIDKIIQHEEAELHRRELIYRGHHPFPELKDKTVILVDDGVATGATIRAAVKGIKKHQPRKIIIAVPVAAHSTCEELCRLADEVICPLKPVDFYAVGLWYQEFEQTTDEEVSRLLSKNRCKPSL